MRRLALATVVLVAVGVAETAVAQPAYPPGAPRNAGRCVRIQVSGRNHGPNNIPPGSNGQVSGLGGCANSLEAGVEVFVEDENNVRTTLGTGTANADGSYAIAVVWPTQEGNYVLGVETQDSVVTRSIEVDQPGGSGGGGGGPPASSSRGGAFLSLWLLILFGIATMLVLGARRRARWFQPIRAMGARLRGRDARAPALPAPDVPFIDTSHFVPVGKQARPERTDALTEADV